MGVRIWCCMESDLTMIKVAALTGYKYANCVALQLWAEMYPDGPLIALTDTFSTEVFFQV